MDTDGVVIGLPCGPHPSEIEHRERVTIVAALIVCLWTLFLFGALALGITFLAGGDTEMSLLCLWVFAGLAAAPVVLLVAERLTVIAKAWLGEQDGGLA